MIPNHGKRLRIIREKFIESILGMSSTVTGLAVILIIIFLFKEGLGLFGEKPMEKDFILAVNPSNPVNKISAVQIKDVFDGKITNWKELGGKDQPIVLFTINDISQYFSDEEVGANFENLPKCINDLMKRDSNLIAYIPNKYLAKDFSGRTLDVDNITVGSFLSGKQWFPTAQPVAQIGALPLILGTLWVCIGAILIALPLGLATSIYMAELANKRIRNILKPVIELLAGIPSVVYGFFGLVIIVPLVQQIFKLPVGETGLSGSIILAIMVLPTIITISEDAIRTTPNAMREASLALGATQWQTIRRVVLPNSMLGITAAVILGVGRAFGETMAVLMVTGNAAVMPKGFLEPIRTLTATIAAELGEASQGGLHYKALFALGCILFIITLFTNLIVEWLTHRRKLA
jgi:phosphate transport system permease protein